MGKEVAPDVFVEKLTGFVFRAVLARVDRVVGSIGIAADVGLGDQTAGVVEGWSALIDVDDRPEFLKAEELPRAWVVIFFPAHIEDVGETEVSLGRRG